MILAALLAAVRQLLVAAGLPNASRDARRLVLGTLDLDAATLIAEPDRTVDETAGEEVLERARRLVEGMPLHRLLGWREFHGLHLVLSPETLEPRDDTEALVELCVPRLRELARQGRRVGVLDLGTGTGAIALALLKEIPEASAVGADINESALDTAGRNASLNGFAERFAIVRANWLEGVEERFTAIVSNPPYIASRTIRRLDPVVRDHDPHLALDGGPDGLDAYRSIAAGAAAHLETGGFIAVEIGQGQEQDVAAIFAANGFKLTDSRADLGGVLRALLFISAAGER